jgi:hypothetical protein
MTIKISKIDMQPGDCLYIDLKGSVENSIFISVREDGSVLLQGPANQTVSRIQPQADGWRLIEQNEKSPLCQEAYEKGVSDGRATQAILELQGRERFLKKLKKE